MQLTYIDNDNISRNIDCEHTIDEKSGRHWIWSNYLQRNLVYKSNTYENALLSSIDSLLFVVKLKDDRIKSLQRIVDLASAFADQIKPDYTENDLY